jgi:uncharacterized protein YcnI
MQLIRTHARRALAALALTLGATGMLAAQASAHAEIGPPTVQKGASQMFTLAVPTEEDNATTTKIVLTVPTGFTIDSFEAQPGWKRAVQATGTGEQAVVQKVTWTGGRTPTGEDSVFRFLGLPAKSGDYTFVVEQTYSNGKIVNWSGPESSDTPSPVLKSVSSIGGGSSNTTGVIALIVAALALVLGLVGLAGGRRSLT